MNENITGNGQHYQRPTSGRSDLKGTLLCYTLTSSPQYSDLHSGFLQGARYLQSVSETADLKALPACLKLVVVRWFLFVETGRQVVGRRSRQVIQKSTR